MPIWEIEVSQEEYDALVLAKEIDGLKVQLKEKLSRRVEAMRVLDEAGWMRSKIAKTFNITGSRVLQILEGTDAPDHKEEAQ